MHSNYDRSALTIHRPITGRMVVGVATLMMSTLTGRVNAQAAPISDRSAVQAAIDSGNAQYIRGFAASEAATVAAVYAPDGGRFGGKGEVARGTAAIRADVAALLGQVGPITVTLKTVDLWVIDDRAYESGKWTYTYAKKGGTGTTTVGGGYVTIWGRQPSGGWRIIADVPS